MKVFVEVKQTCYGDVGTSMEGSIKDSVNYLPHVAQKSIASMSNTGTVAAIKCSACGGDLMMYSAKVVFTVNNMEGYLKKFGNCWKISDGKTYPNCVGYNPDKHCKHCGAEFANTKTYSMEV